MRGQIINCPHCTLSLALELASAPAAPSPAPALPSGNLYQRLRALNNLSPKANPIELPEAFNQNPAGSY